MCCLPARRQSPVATTLAFSTINTAVPTGTTGRCNIPAGTVNACRGPKFDGGSVREFDAEQPVQDEEELVLLVVLVPVKLALHDPQAHDNVADLGQRLVVPRLLDLVDQRLHTHRLQLPRPR